MNNDQECYISSGNVDEILFFGTYEECECWIDSYAPDDAFKFLIHDKDTGSVMSVTWH